jgi:hypothetical protein
MPDTDVDTALNEHVMRKLEDSFGKAVAMMIFASAIRAAGVPTGELTVGEYRRLVGAICCDQRCIDMWGDAAAEETRVQWEKLVQAG